MPIDEGMLLKISIISALLGLVILFILSGSITVDETTIRKMTDGSVSDVVLTGKVVSVTDKGELTILRIEKTESVEVIVFEGSMQIEEGMDVRIKGSVDDGSILAERVERLS